MSGVRVTDNGAAKFVANLKALAARRVRVGVLDDAPKRSGENAKGGRASLLEVAVHHEFGAPAAGIPQRSFIRATVDLNAGAIASLQKTLAAQVGSGQVDGDTALERLGMKVAAMCQNRVAEGIGPALAPATVERKGSSKPLVDTGQLRSSITWKVG